METMDITDIRHQSASFDAIYCSHVLEHVPNDKKAMGEFFRVLKPGGWAALQVPIPRDKTYEDWSITAPLDRAAAFGQSDHVRIYGLDIVERLREVGFEVRVEETNLLFTATEIARFGLSTTEPILFCRKPSP